MQSQIVFLASFLAVCIRNSKSLETHYCKTDHEASIIIGNHSNEDEVVPIYVIEGDEHPMNDENSDIKKCINENFANLIIVNNTDNACPHADNVLHQDVDGRLYPALFLTRGGYLMKPFKWTDLTSKAIPSRILNASTNCFPAKKGLNVSLNIANRIRKATQNPGIVTENPMENPVGNPQRIPEERPTRMIVRRNDSMRSNPPNSAISQYGHDQGQSSGQPRTQMNTPMTAAMINYQDYQMERLNVNKPSLLNQPTLPNQSTLPFQPLGPPAVYPTRSTRPVELNLLGSMDNQQGRKNNLAGNAQTFPPTQEWSYHNKKPRYDGGSST